MKEIKELSDSEVIFYVLYFTEEYLRSEGWSKSDMRALYKKYNEIAVNGGQK